MQNEQHIDDSIHGSTNTLRAIEAIDAAVARERERCAKIAETSDNQRYALGIYQGVEIAAAIRNA